MKSRLEKAIGLSVSSLLVQVSVSFGFGVGEITPQAAERNVVLLWIRIWNVV